MSEEKTINPESITFGKYLCEKIPKIYGVLIFNRNSKESLVIKDTPEMNLGQLSSVISDFSQYCDHMMLAVNDGSQIVIRAFGEDYIVVYSSRATQGALTLYFKTYTLSNETTLVEKTLKDGVGEEGKEIAKTNENIGVAPLTKNIKPIGKSRKKKPKVVGSEESSEPRSENREVFSVERI